MNAIDHEVVILKGILRKVSTVGEDVTRHGFEP